MCHCWTLWIPTISHLTKFIIQTITCIIVIKDFIFTFRIKKFIFFNNSIHIF